MRTFNASVSSRQRHSDDILIPTRHIDSDSVDTSSLKDLLPSVRYGHRRHCYGPSNLSKNKKNKTHHRTAHSFLLQRLRQYNKSPLFRTAVFSTSRTSSLYVYYALEPDLQPKKLCSSIPDVQRALRCPLMAIQRLTPRFLNCKIPGF
jgi:hypothetical protein